MSRNDNSATLALILICAFVVAMALVVVVGLSGSSKRSQLCSSLAKSWQDYDACMREERSILTFETSAPGLKILDNKEALKS